MWAVGTQRFLKERQYADTQDVSVTDLQLRELQLLAWITQRAPVRTIQILQPPQRPLVVYSDASYENGQAFCGWVVFHLDGVPVGQSIHMSDQWISALEPRENQIFAAESFCSLLVPFNLPHLFRGRDVLWFVDNEAAAAAMIRGSSGSSDVDRIVQLASVLMLKLGARLWVEWINSDSNPSDGLSRIGITDPWTVSQGWRLSAASLPSTAIGTTLEWFEILH